MQLLAHTYSTPFPTKIKGRVVGGNKKQCYRSGINVVKKSFKSIFITEREDLWCFWCVFGKILHIGKKTVDSMIFL